MSNKRFPILKALTPLQVAPVAVFAVTQIKQLRACERLGTGIEVYECKDDDTKNHCICFPPTLGRHDDLLYWQD
jgi:hypothetical protein